MGIIFAVRAFLLKTRVDQVAQFVGVHTAGECRRRLVHDALQMLKHVGRGNKRESARGNFKRS